MADEHPARAASHRSMSAVSRNAREEWLALFADDAIIEDPIGVSILDPEGNGFRGRDEIAGFWDRNIGTNKIQFDMSQGLTQPSLNQKMLQRC